LISLTLSPFGLRWLISLTQILLRKMLRGGDALAPGRSRTLVLAIARPAAAPKVPENPQPEERQRRPRPLGRASQAERLAFE